MTPSGVKAEKLYSHKPHNGNGDFTHDRNLGTATRVNKDGYIETVAADVPRLDYPIVDGVVQDCPALLLEPSRTNWIVGSNDFTNWTLGGTVSRTSNYGISPDGTQNSVRADFSNGGIIYRTPNKAQGAYVFSVFAKNIEGGGSQILLRADVPSAKIAIFDLSNGTIISHSTDDAKIEDYGNGWYRCILIQNDDQVINAVIGEGTTELDCELFGAQLESGSYPTSYIKTTTATVTRNADVCDSAGTSAEFNDSEGVLYAEIAALAETGRIALNDGTTNNNVRFVYNSGTNRIDAILYNGSNQASLQHTLPIEGSFNKIAFKYKPSDFSLYVDGFEVDSLTASGTTFSSGTLSELNFDAGNGLVPFNGRTKELAVFKEALTDSELEALTSWDSFNDMAKGQEYTIR